MLEGDRQDPETVQRLLLLEKDVQRLGQWSTCRAGP
jgi:hypothetical protein